MFFKFFTGITCCLILSNLYSSGNGLTPQTLLTGVPAIHRSMWSVMGNPAGFAEEKSFSASSYYQSVFLLKQTSATGFVVVVPAGKVGNIGAVYRQFGYSLYKEQMASVAFSRTFGSVVSAAIRFDYLATRFGNEYGHSGAFTGSAGLIARFTESLRLGVCVFNPQRTPLSGNSEERYPGIMQAGVSWSFGNQSELQFGVSKAVDAKPILQCGIQYHVSERFHLHAGISNGYEPFSLGYSFRMGKLIIGMSSGYHYWLGFSPRFSITFKNN